MEQCAAGEAHPAADTPCRNSGQAWARPAHVGGERPHGAAPGSHSLGDLGAETDVTKTFGGYPMNLNWIGRPKPRPHVSTLVAGLLRIEETQQNVIADLQVSPRRKNGPRLCGPRRQVGRTNPNKQPKGGDQPAGQLDIRRVLQRAQTHQMPTYHDGVEPRWPWRWGSGRSKGFALRPPNVVLLAGDRDAQTETVHHVDSCRRCQCSPGRVTAAGAALVHPCEEPVEGEGGKVEQAQALS